MADQTIEFTAGAGETFAVKAVPAGASTPVKTANSVVEVTDEPGLYRATFTDQNLSVALWRFWATAGGEFAGRGMVNITASSGTFRETEESSATVDMSSSIAGIVAGVVSGFNEEGVVVSMALPAFLAQLAAAEIEFANNPPQVGRMTLYSGCDHLQAAGNGKTFRNPAGSWPNLDDYTVYLEVSTIGKSTREEAIVVVAEGIEQEICCQMRNATLVAASMTAGEGEFVIIAEKGADETLERIPLAGGVLLIKHGVAPAAAA